MEEPILEPVYGAADPEETKSLLMMFARWVFFEVVLFCMAIWMGLSRLRLAWLVLTFLTPDSPPVETFPD